jgi:hypothetical protein
MCLSAWNKYKEKKLQSLHKKKADQLMMQVTEAGMLPGEISSNNFHRNLS